METRKMYGCAWEHEGSYIFGNKALKDILRMQAAMFFPLLQIPMIMK